MVFNATFNFISVISWWSVLLVENKGNNKITEHRVNKQTTSVNNRKTGKTAKALTWYRHFQRNGGLNQILWHQTSRFHYG